jgi:hypothetical protein
MEEYPDGPFPGCKHAFAPGKRGVGGTFKFEEQIEYSSCGVCKVGTFDTTKNVCTLKQRFPKSLEGQLKTNTPIGCNWGGRCVSDGMGRILVPLPGCKLGTEKESAESAKRILDQAFNCRLCGLGESVPGFIRTEKGRKSLNAYPAVVCTPNIRID